MTEQIHDYYTYTIDADLLRSLVGKNRIKDCLHLREAYVAKGSKKCNYIINEGIVVGKGLLGKVYEACCEDQKDCKYVARISSMLPYHYDAIVYQSKASQNGLAPKIHEVWLCKETRKFVIIMDKMDTTFRTYLETLDRDGQLEAMTKLSQAVHKLHKLGIVHGDLHFNNVMVNETTGDIKFIDFERAENLLTGRNDLKDMEFLMRDIKSVEKMDESTKIDARKIVLSVLE